MQTNRSASTTLEKILSLIDELRNINSEIADRLKEEILIKEAERRGYKKGVKVKCLKDWHTKDQNGDGTIKTNDFMYETSTDILWTDSNSIDYCIYEQGKWAEIVKDEKIIVNGHEMHKDGDRIWFGNQCTKFTTYQMNNLNRAIKDFNSGEVWTNCKIKSITLDSGVTMDIETINKICNA